MITFVHPSVKIYDLVCLLKCDWVYSVGYQNACSSVFTVHLFLCYHCFLIDRSMAAYTKVNQNSTKYSAQRTLELENIWCLTYYFLVGFGDIVKFKFIHIHAYTHTQRRNNSTLTIYKLFLDNWNEITKPKTNQLQAMTELQSSLEEKGKNLNF